MTRRTWHVVIVRLVALILAGATRWLALEEQMRWHLDPVTVALAVGGALAVPYFCSLILSAAIRRWRWK